MIDLNDVLLAMSNIPVDDPIAEIWGRGLQGGYKIIEYTGTLPSTINANGDVLIDYRIYGASGGVGEVTENLINASLSEQTIEIKPSTKYVICKYTNIYAKYLIFGIYDENDNLIWSDYLGSFTSENIPVRANTKYFKISIPDNCLNVVSLVEGQTTSVIIHVPESYIPYGYKLPMTVSDGNTAQTVPVYIGENQLDAGEYVSYSDGKIYRIVDGTLTPTDPPVPLPEIPTIDGTTTIDYDGTPKPSQMYVKYKSKG